MPKKNFTVKGMDPEHRFTSNLHYALSRVYTLGVTRSSKDQDDKEFRKNFKYVIRWIRKIDPKIIPKT